MQELLLNHPSLLPILIGAVSSLNVLVGGWLVFRFKDHFNTILGISGGVMIGTVAFEVLPEVTHLLQEFKDVEQVGTLAMVCLVSGILIFHFLSKFLPLHEQGHHVTHEHHHHTHATNKSLGMYGALAIIVHSFVDGFGIGVGMSASIAVGISVSLAVLSHNISDGVNTTATLLNDHFSKNKIKIFLGANALAPLLGVLFSLWVVLNEKFLLYYLAFFSGSILYLAISDILPHAHSDSKKKSPLIGTLLGVVFALTLSLYMGHGH